MSANLSITNTLYYIVECVSDNIFAFNDYDNFRDNFSQPVTSLVKVNIITLSEGTQTLASFLTLIYEYKLKLQSQSWSLETTIIHTVHWLV